MEIGSDSEVDREGGNSSAEIIDDIMLLNEEVEALDASVTAFWKRLRMIGEVLQAAQYEDIGERDENQASAELSLDLASSFLKLKALESELQQLVAAFEELRKKHKFTDAPISYMLQLPPLQGKEELEQKRLWIHTLADQLTGKTNCEMRVELLVLKDCCRYAEHLKRVLSLLYSRAAKAHSAWEPLLDELASLDFSPLQDQWLQSELR